MLYEIKLRIYEYNFEGQNKELIYFGDGVVNIQEDSIDGYIARDYISGTIKNDVIEITVYDVDFKQEYYLISGDDKVVEFQGKYILYSSDGFMEAEISFDKRLSKEKYEDVEKELKKIRHLANR